ncbi:helix-turn-helix transcriptional regulator (plasmid) [Bacillus thuringiensis]|uniref:helix-turn-helix domain-containing protein n=1 Tax=Bacillus thuringiensis TaxID=1428 RepID=UPI003D72C0AF
MNNKEYINFDRITQDSDVWEKRKYKGYAPLHRAKTPTGVRIKLGDYLKSIDMSQRSLAELCGMTQPMINDLCENRNTFLNISHLVRIVSVLGIGIEDIIETTPIQDTAYTEADSIYNVINGKRSGATR